LLVEQRAQLSNCVRSLLAEAGIVAAAGGRGFAELRARLNETADPQIAPALHEALRAMAGQIDQLTAAISRLEERIVASARQHPAMRWLASIPGIGAITAHGVVRRSAMAGSSAEPGISPPGAG
jgi:transposase